MILPAIILVYGGAAACFGVKGMAPPGIGAVKDFFWYIVAGLCVVTAGIGLYAVFMADKETSPAAKKAKKPPKAKKPKKPKKPKKAKK